jgi:hypothetical protein
MYAYRVRPDPAVVQFHIAEYSSLHGEIRELNGEARALERYVLFTTGGVWAWLLTEGSGVVDLFAFFIPAIFSLMGFLRVRAIRTDIANIAAYVRKIEDALAGFPNLPGWHIYRHPDLPEPRLKLGKVTRSANLFWFTMILATVLVPLVFLWAHSMMKC